MGSITDVANYLEDYKEKWDKIFQQENEKNKNKPFGEKNYEYENTIKHRKIRTQCFTISVGIILSYILYIILKINEDTISRVFAEYLSNKYILVFGQWFVAILFLIIK